MAKNNEAKKLIREYEQLTQDIAAAMKEAARLHKRFLATLDQHHIGKLRKKIEVIEEE